MPSRSEQQMDPTTAYTQLDPAERSAMAQAFIDHFRQLNDPGSREFARVDPHYVSAAQLAQMHEYAADAHPAILAEVMEDPVIKAALGGFAAAEVHKLLEEKHR
jgi:hypothetical protein